ncbi:transglutaminase-like cysteine peptidase [Thiosulfativibrio zosterae]|uniref:Sulfate adenylyltransferase n=1 Tax=Thiosulfativibrio zosterae TaxID=2675053 RepID=A0A6F8PQE0_9GAMM|nr:transglutaminase-like cysteine peptidase [Thiosulfativibrio zosterae]BBP44248.1 sulfate adenylyltransferase [Thiosulfativibrio zosterae]
MNLQSNKTSIRCEKLNPKIFIWILIGPLIWLGVVFSANTPQVVSKAEIQEAKEQFGPLAVKRLEAWQALIDNNQNKPEKLKLTLVNDFFNQAKYIDDLTHWKKDDYWATPYEFLTTDAGDCEDYVIAKYFTLKALGVEESKLFLTYVKAIRLKQAHMVLTYFENPKDQPLVLDNLTDKILFANRRKDLAPIYSFNGDGLWLSKQRGKGQKVDGGTDKLKEWNRLLQKLEKS